MRSLSFNFLHFWEYWSPWKLLSARYSFHRHMKYHNHGHYSEKVIVLGQSEYEIPCNEYDYTLFAVKLTIVPFVFLIF